MKQSNVTRAALYLRLSRDDDTNGDSESIQTQRMMLRGYAEEQGFIIVDEYIDDGWSGTNFNRPGFQRMLDDIEDGKINCVITKDLSRLGRNYILTGQYTEIYFPSKNVRYIAINDNVDTQKGDNELAPFLNILNEMHARQTSKKVKAAKLARLKSGQYLATTPPFGYAKDPDKKNHLIIDEETAPVVRRIFDLCCRGYGRTAIARILTEENVQTPGWYAYVKYGAFANFYENSCDKQYVWDRSCIAKILKDEVYVGNATGQKSKYVSYKNKRRIVTPVDDRVVIESTHEPIISKEIFDAAQSAIKKRLRTPTKWDNDLFAGLLFCPDCGRQHVRGANHRVDGTRIYNYRCGTNHQYGNAQCSSHYIPYADIYNIVLSRLQCLLSFVSLDDDSFANMIIEANNSEHVKQIKKVKNDLKKSEKRLKELDKMYMRLYDDWGRGTITEHNFSLMSDKLQTEQTLVKNQIADLTVVLNSYDESKVNIDCWINTAKQFLNPTSLNRDLLVSLIDKIYIHQAKQDKDGTKTQEIEICYKFIGKIDDSCH